jgi:crotonobetainyl-CoA:carnitine CoA-transferase CaiB-like acyl-CoA transferase
VSGPELAVATCRRRLAPVLARVDNAPRVDCAISWHGPAGAALGERGSEAAIQARSGLMEVHGWDAGHPRRLGLDVASVAAGLLAANGVLATMVAAERGCPSPPRVETSVLQGGLLLIAHHLAAATASGEPLASPPGPDPGPPFRTADDRWFEIEVFDPDGWKSFWARLGAAEAALGRGWTAFRARYYRGRCSLPTGLHQATRRHTLAHASDAAAACGVSLCPLRSYAEVAVDRGLPDRHPLAASTGPRAGRPGRPKRWREKDLPLRGVRVVEATSRMQGPLAGLLLHQLGAEVTRIEPPGGDVGRSVPPYCDDVGSFFCCYNRGKQSVQLDLGRPQGREELLSRMAGADVFLHNWRPGQATTWGLDDTAAHAANPRLVYAAATGWGHPNANPHLIGTDFLVQAYAGFGEGLNPVGEPPATSRVLLTDCLGALVTCEGILSGLYQSATTGHGVAVTTSLLEGALAAQAHVLEALAGGDTRRPGGRPAWGPLDVPLPTEEGMVVVTAQDPDRRRLRRLAHAPATADDAEIARCLAAVPARHWEKLLPEAGVPCAVVTRDLAALTTDERISALFEPLGDSCRAPASPWVWAS